MQVREISSAWLEVEWLRTTPLICARLITVRSAVRIRLGPPTKIFVFRKKEWVEAGKLLNEQARELISS